MNCQLLPVVLAGRPVKSVGEGKGQEAVYGTVSELIRWEACMYMESQELECYSRAQTNTGMSIPMYVHY